MGRRKRVEEEEETAKMEEPDTSESRSLYEVLGVSSNATHEEIRRAYHKSALRLHPDKNPDDEDAKEKFQQLQNVMAILGDPEKRELYDQTGSIDAADIDGDAVKSLYKFLRTLFKQVTEEDIEAFSASYRGSKEEAKDLVASYIKFKGDFKKVFNQMMCSDPQVDSHRFMDIIDAAIAAGEVKEYKVYRKWASEVSKTPRPPNPLGPSKKKKKKNGESTSELAALINHRGQKQMDSLASALAAKYGNKGKGSKGGKSSQIVDEPSEEEFLAAQKRVLKKSKK
ncbi:hypothetical protein M758_7G161600 [Ceratodon purpureus]|uniref:J domain-containing protein n=1 Tax=Ceratodon purpureus TaxID=3225 RepID=A0A8T0H943_CERPU|nr:hypothetical protein KC19_7G119300 [Ceratodon purpureus]KAG0611737.1 hypothetical protein M758_7G161600 [Ceratodon purpureus]